MCWESVGCKIHVCQLNSKGSTGSQKRISGVILIFIAGMVGFRRNSSITNLASLGHHANKLTPSTNITKKTFFVTLLLVKNWEFPFYTCRISLHDWDHRCVFSHLKVATNVDGITASGHQCCGHTIDLQQDIVTDFCPCWYNLQWKIYIIYVNDNPRASPRLLFNANTYSYSNVMLSIKEKKQHIFFLIQCMWLALCYLNDTIG